MTPTVADVYKTLLKDNKLHTQKYIDDLEQDFLPTTVKNKIILAKNNKVFEDNPDFDLDHIDNVLGEPENTSEMSDEDIMHQDLQYQQDAAYEQMEDSKVAEQLAKNYADEKKYYNALASVPKEGVSEAKHTRRQAFSNIHDMTLDTILKRIYADKNMSDEDKIEAALRLMYNNATRDWATGPVDMKLDQDEIANAMILNGTYDAMEAIDPTFLNKSRVLTDQVPMTYMSDKNFENGAEESLFTPTKEANTVYDMFAKRYLADLTKGTAPDRSEIPAYIHRIFADSLKTMTALDWQKVLDKEAEEMNKAKEQALGRPLKEHEKVELEYTSGEDKLTPEDWIDQMPDNPKLGKSAAEKADSKLNRWHGDSKEDYKKFMELMALKSVEGSPEHKHFEQEMGMLSMAILSDAINNKIPELVDQFELEDLLGNEAAANQIAKRLAYYKVLVQDTPEGHEELRYQAYRNLVNSLRDSYNLNEGKGDINNRITEAKRRNAAYKEFYDNLKAKDKPSWLNTNTSNDDFDNIDKLQKDLDKGIDRK